MEPDDYNLSNCLVFWDSNGVTWYLVALSQYLGWRHGDEIQETLEKSNYKYHFTRFSDHSASLEFTDLSLYTYLKLKY